MTTINTTLPDWWIETTLGEVCDIVMWQSPKWESYNLIWDWLPFYQWVTEFWKKFVTIKTYTNQPTRIVNPNTLLFSVRAPVWRVNFTEHQACIGRWNAWLIMKNWNQDFLYYLLNFIEKQIINRSSWTVFDSISWKELKEIPLAISKNNLEQQAIAKILSPFDDKIELLREQNVTLEKIAQTIFEEWFGKYSFDDELPEGWRVGKLGEVIKFIKWKKPSDTSETFIDWYIPQILIETFDSWKITYANPKNTVLTNENDLIMVMDWASSWRLEIWYNWIVWSTLSKIEIEEDLRLLVFALLKSKFKEINDGTTGSSIPHTDKAKIYDFDYFITDKDYLKNFNQLYWNFLSKILDNKKQIQTLSKTRDELLPKLMKGEVKVV